MTDLSLTVWGLIARLICAVLGHVPPERWTRVSDDPPTGYWICQRCMRHSGTVPLDHPLGP